MTLDATFVLWLIMLLMLVQIIPMNGKWTKLLVWSVAVLVTIVLVLLKVLALK